MTAKTSYSFGEILRLFPNENPAMVTDALGLRLPDGSYPAAAVEARLRIKKMVRDMQREHDAKEEAIAAAAKARGEASR